MPEEIRTCLAAARDQARLTPVAIGVVTRPGTGPAGFDRVDERGCWWWVARYGAADQAVDDASAAVDSAQRDGPGVVCLVVGFTDSHDRRVALIYPPERATWHPFCQSGDGDHSRDSLQELRVRDALADAGVRMEPDLTQWLALWDDSWWPVSPDPSHGPAA